MPSPPDAPSWALVSVRVRSTEAARSIVFARRHQFVVGKALTFDREDPEVSAMEYLAAAVAADVAGTFRKVARERRLPLDEVEAVARGELRNPLTFLGVVGEDGEPSLKTLALKVYACTGAPEAEVRGVWEAALARSPLVTTLRPVLDLRLELHLSS